MENANYKVSLLQKFIPYGTNDKNSKATYRLVTDPGNDKGEQEITISSSKNEVFWSSANQLIQIFQLPSPVLDVAFANFSNKKLYLDICVLHSEGLSIYAAGQEYSVVLPCKVSNIWASSYGLILQRTIESVESKSHQNSPVLFSLTNPIEEIKPFSCEQEFFCNTSHEIISCSVNFASFLATYDNDSRVLVFWKVEREPENLKSFQTLIQNDNLEQQYPFTNLLIDQQEIEEQTIEQITSQISITKIFETQKTSKGEFFFSADENSELLGCYFKEEEKILDVYKFNFYEDLSGDIDMTDPSETRHEPNENEFKAEFFFSLMALQAIPIRSNSYGKTRSWYDYDILIRDLENQLILYKSQTPVFTCGINLEPEKKILKIFDPIEDRFNILVSDNTTYRCSILLSNNSDLVSECFSSFRCLLPNDTVNQILRQFLDQKNLKINSAGSNDHEWFILVENVLFPLLGLKEPTTDVLDFEKENDKNPNDSDWNFLINSEYHFSISKDPIISNLKNINENNENNFLNNNLSNFKKNSHLDLFKDNNFLNLFLSLHLLYENSKLNVLKQKLLFPLATLLMKISISQNMEDYIDYYSRDFVELSPKNLEFKNEENEEQKKQKKKKNFPNPLDIYKFLISKLKNSTKNKNNQNQNSEVSFFPILEKYEETNFSRILCKSYSLLCSEKITNKYENNYELTRNKILKKSKNNESLIFGKNCFENTVLCLVQENITLQDLECIPFGLALPLREAIKSCRKSPPRNWPVEAYVLIGREDLAFRYSDVIPKPFKQRKEKPEINLEKTEENSNNESNFSIDEITDLRFRKDSRIHEVEHLLQSTEKVELEVQDGAELSDHELREQQQTLLMLLAVRTMALAVGRGIFTLSTIETPLLTEAIPTLPLNLDGKVSGSHTSVSFSEEILVEEALDWPEFHNGMAAGLRISKEQTNITSTWIVYNKPEEVTATHAGLLMALGINGHLSSLALTRIYDYLSSGHNLTSIGLLIGISATNLGNMSQSVAKLLSVHIPALHPPSSTNLEVPSQVQTAALMGTGLLYAGTSHRRMTEILLDEIGSGPNDDKYFDREGYCLTAGIALGLVNIGKGNEESLSDLHIEERLVKYLNGAPNTSKILPSSLILEPQNSNIDVTAPGAILALGLIFLKTNNNSVAARLQIPDTPYLLDYVRPDFVLLRTLSRNLVLWDSVEPTQQWFNSQIPPNILKLISTLKNDVNHIDYNGIKETHLNIIVGSCLSLGIKFAGSFNQHCFEILKNYINDFEILREKVTADKEKLTIETLLCLICLSLSSVMAGSGNLETLNLFKKIRKGFVNTQNSYGNHMSIHMAIGFLFLSGGKLTFGTSNIAVACLLITFYPKFPLISLDNRYHLQAFRHLYVLATESRCLICTDVDTLKPCYIPIQIYFKDQNLPKFETVVPCLLPEFDKISYISLNTPRYWNQIIDFKNDTDLNLILTRKSKIWVKRKTGFLSYLEDPKGTKNLLSRPFPKYFSTIYCIKSGKRKKKNITEFIDSFFDDPNILSFVRHFCINENQENNENNQIQDSNIAFYTSVLYECLTKEKPEILNTYLSIFELMKNLKNQNSNLNLLNIKIIIQFYNYFQNSVENENLIDINFLTAVETKINNNFKKYNFISNNSNEISNLLKNYIQNGNFYFQNQNQKQNENQIENLNLQLSLYLSFFDIPPPKILKKAIEIGKKHSLDIKKQNQHLQFLSFLPLFQDSSHSTLLNLLKYFIS